MLIVDQEVTLVVRFRNNLLPDVFPSAPTTVTYTGKVINRAKYDHPESVRIFTGEKQMMIRVIQLKDIISINGDPVNFQPKPKPASLVQPGFKIIDGSRGKQYKLTIYPNGNVTCTCPGFGYRQECRHVKDYLNQEEK